MKERMKIERVKLDSLTPDPHNARLHSARNLEAIKASLTAFGQQKPIVVGSDGVVVAGNGTLEAARSLGWSDIAIVRTELAGDEARAFAIADNRTAELAEWDREKLDESISSMSSDLAGVVGFNEKELSMLAAAANPPASLTSTPASDEEMTDAPEPLAHGTIVRIGPHTLCVADPCTDIQEWSPLLSSVERVVPFASCSAYRNTGGKVCLFLQPNGRYAAWLVRNARLDNLEVSK